VGTELHRFPYKLDAEPAASVLGQHEHVEQEGERHVIALHPAESDHLVVEIEPDDRAARCTSFSTVSRVRPSAQYESVKNL